MKPASSRLRPSFYGRVVVAALLLFGFYVFMLAVSGVLFALPILLVLSNGFRLGTWFLFVCAACWIPAGLIVRGLFTVRPPAFTPPGRLLEPHDAPELFAIVHDLAARAGTTPPARVYLDARANLAVLEHGGILRGERILIVGYPFLDMLTVQELRAGLAHELGHFAGGDTRLGRILTYTRSSFHSVFSAVQRGAFRAGTSHASIEMGFALAKAFGEGLTRLYARLYLLVTSAASRRQELAADALAAELAGREAAIRLLEKTFSAAMYDLYLRLEVRVAVEAGAMPVDLLDGYRAFRVAFDKLPVGAAAAAADRTAETDPFDTHPATPVRIDGLRALPLPGGPVEDDPRPAAALLRDPERMGEWLVDATMAVFEPQQVLTRCAWAQIPAGVYAPMASERARQVAEALHPQFASAQSVAEMFGCLVAAFERGEATRVLSVFLNRPARPADIEVAGRLLLGPLFEGALLERGGMMDHSFGAPSLVIVFEGEGVPAAKIAADAMSNDGARALLKRWSDRLVSSKAADTIATVVA